MDRAVTWNEVQAMFAHGRLGDLQSWENGRIYRGPLHGVCISEQDGSILLNLDWLAISSHVPASALEFNAVDWVFRVRSHRFLVLASVTPKVRDVDGAIEFQLTKGGTVVLWLKDHGQLDYRKVINHPDSLPLPCPK